MMLYMKIIKNIIIIVIISIIWFIGSQLSEQVPVWYKFWVGGVTAVFTFLIKDIVKGVK